MSAVKTIQLTQGKKALVDDHWFEYLSQWKWGSITRGHTQYAVRTSLKSEGGPRTIYMHRVIWELENDPVIEVDHRDRNGLNNQTCNLRKATRSQQGQNQKLRKDNKSRYKGITYRKGRWRARIYVHGRELHLGYFSTDEEAATVYDKAALQHFGDFSRLNFPSS